MLYKETVGPDTLELLRKLNQDPLLNDFCLAGGTGLALQIGHRISNDLDLFSLKTFDSEYFLDYLSGKYGFKPDFSAENTLKGSIDGIKLDILAHCYRLVDETISVENIRLYSTKDIAAMKVNAIAGNGTRSKDFVDLHFLLRLYSVREIIDFYSVKYEDRNILHAIKSLNYFDEVNLADWPVILKERDLKWTKVKSEINKCVKSYIKSI